MSADKFLVFAKPFIEAIKNVHETMVFTKVETGKPSYKTDTLTKGDISAVMGMNGSFESDGGTTDFKGMLVISWPEGTYIKIASAMLMESFEEYCDEIADVGGEITNIIMGNAKRDLGQDGYKLEMSIPSMVRGMEHSIKYPQGAKVVLIPMTCQHGEFFMEICYKD